MKFGSFINNTAFVGNMSTQFVNIRGKPLIVIKLKNELEMFNFIVIALFDLLLYTWKKHLWAQAIWHFILRMINLFVNWFSYPKRNQGIQCLINLQYILKSPQNAE